MFDNNFWTVKELPQIRITSLIKNETSNFNGQGTIKKFYFKFKK